jgi:thiol:disulfide interchange protein DsbA
VSNQDQRQLTSPARHWLAATVVALLAACGSPPGNGNTPASAEPAAPPAAAPTPAPEVATPAQPAASAQATPSGVQETTTSEGGPEIRLASAATPAGSTQWRFKEGQDFKVLTAAQGTTGAPGKIEVAEAFWYGCSHCYQFDPLLSDWAKKLPTDVAFVRIPVMWNPTNQIHARLFYTVQALGKAEEMHAAIFREIHVNRNLLTTEDEIQKFFAKFGVSAEDFQKTFRSFAVEGQLKRAKDLTERYQVRSVPMMIVDGKYTSDAPGIKTFDDMLAVVTELTERERRR